MTPTNHQVDNFGTFSTTNSRAACSVGLRLFGLLGVNDPGLPVEGGLDEVGWFKVGGFGEGGLDIGGLDIGGFEVG